MKEEVGDNPIKEPEEELNFVEVGKSEDFEEGKGKLVIVNDQKIAMFRYKGKIGAISHVCAHQGGPLAEGEIKNGYVVCPWHGYEYDPFTGKGPPGFKDTVPSFVVKEENGKVFISSSVEKKEVKGEVKTEDKKNEEYLGEWARSTDDFEKKYARIVSLAKGNKSEISSMRTQRPYPDWDSILFKGAQLYRKPLNDTEDVQTKTIIGKTATHPLELDIPFYVSHMSFGALSREAKIALAKGSAIMKTVMCSGEGGMLPESRQEATKYIYEIGTAWFSHKDESIKKADAVEIKIGQATKPGMGGHLPKDKITHEIAKIRDIPYGEDSVSPGRNEVIEKDGLDGFVKHLKDLTDGKPIGIKFAAGHIEKDLAEALKAKPDFITIDNRGGATGASPTHIKDNVCVPAIFTLRRARKYLDSVNSDVTLCITGGIRDSADIAKALALGADAIPLATSSLLAIGCQQYRICATNNCPVGITTQKPELRERFVVEKSVERFVNFYKATKEELKDFARINGRANVHDLSLEDVFTIDNEISMNTDIEHA